MPTYPSPNIVNMVHSHTGYDPNASAHGVWNPDRGMFEIAGQGAMHSHQLPPMSPGYDVMGDIQSKDPFNLMRMIAMRMRWNPGVAMPYTAICPAFADDMVHVMVISNKNPPIVLSDEWSMFPSDKLITELRLLEEK